MCGFTAAPETVAGIGTHRSAGDEAEGARSMTVAGQSPGLSVYARGHLKLPGNKILDTGTSVIAIFGYLAHFCVKDLPGYSDVEEIFQSFFVEMTKKGHPPGSKYGLLTMA